MVLRAMAQGLAERGVTIEVATTDDNGPERMSVPLGQPIMDAGVAYRYFPRQTAFYTCSWPLAVWLRRHVNTYDLVHIHALFSFPSTVASWAAQAGSVPYVVRPLGILNRWGVTQRRPFLKRMSFRLCERRILNGAAAVQYTSAQERLEAEELGFSAPASIIPNPVEVGSPQGFLRTKYPQLTGKFVVLFLSRLDPKKGLDLLLPAFQRMQRALPDAVLVIAGTGAPQLEASMKALARDLGLVDHVLWLGFVDGPDKWSAYVESDLFVLPSYSENFGVAAVEAMAFERPVVVSDQVGIHGEIASRQAGLVTPCDVNALSASLIRLAEDPDLRRRMGRNGKQLARSTFSTEAVCRSLIRLYENVACRACHTYPLPESIS